MIDIFKTGDKQALTDILDNKEERERYKKSLLGDHRDKTLISVSFNIPGDIRNNEYITRGFCQVIEDFNYYLVKSGLAITLIERFDKPTGPEAYYLIDTQDSVRIKEICVEYEKGHRIGRLLDIDVYQLVDSQLQIIDRDSLQQPPRLCFICAQPAKECTRNQTHSIEELRAKLNEMFDELL